MTYLLSNLDPYNALEIGSLSLPLVFQVAIKPSIITACYICHSVCVSI